MFESDKSEGVGFVDNIWWDFLVLIVVFFVVLLFCMGIVIVLGVLVVVGLIIGIVGGLVVVWFVGCLL